MKKSHSTTAFWSRTTLIAALLLVVPVFYGSSFGNTEAAALRLRAEPNLTAPALALITAAQETGGLDLDFGDIYDGGKTPDIELPAEPLLAYVNTDGSVLNIRSGPGTAFTTVGQASSGSFLTVLSNENGWCSVLYNNAIAYVSTDYVRLMTKADYDAFKASADYRGEQIAQHAQNYLGRPYVYGANGPNSFDCSGFTKYVYAQFGYSLNRTATDQLANGYSVEKSELKAGDLVFFRSEGTVKPVSHVGLYMGDGSFIHASTNNYQIRIDNLSSGYYSGIFVGARRVV